jgi:hypothetical protein
MAQKIESNVEVISPEHYPGGIYFPDVGGFVFFRKEFPLEQLDESVEKVTIAEDLKSLQITKRALHTGSFPLGLVFFALFYAAIALAGRHLTQLTIVLKDGRAVSLKADRLLANSMEKQWKTAKAVAV